MNRSTRNIINVSMRLTLCSRSGGSFYDNARIGLELYEAQIRISKQRTVRTHTWSLGRVFCVDFNSARGDSEIYVEIAASWIVA